MITRRAARESWWRHWLVLACAMVGTYSAAIAQTSAKDLEHAWKGKRFGLRCLSADPVVRYQLTNGALSCASPHVHSLTMLLVDSVNLRGSTVTVKGTQTTLAIDERKGTPGITGGSPMKLEVDLRGADPATTLSDLADLLFFPDMQAEIDAVPGPLRKIVPYGVKKAKASTVGADDTFQYFDAGEWKSIPRTASTIEPRVLRAVEPEYSEEARSQKMSASVWFAFRVTQDGKVDDLWLTRAAGQGLDEKAEAAIRQYVFAPAQVDGRTVEVTLTTEINFEIF